MRFVYLHGFASSPGSKKAQFFRERFAELGIGLEIPALDGGNFEGLTITGQLEVIERAAGGEPVSLFGSSMGGYLAALYAAGHAEVEKLVLMAPAFSFPARWPETLGEEAMEDWKRTGVRKFFHYSEGREVALGYQLIEDAQRYPAYPSFQQPALIFHGKNDATVPAEYSVTFAQSHPNARLYLMESDHELGNVMDEMWMGAEEFLFGPGVGNSTRR